MNQKFLKDCFGVLLVAFTIVACAGGLTPKDPLWDREACAHCRMTISQHRYATQLLGPGASVRYYDDLGCALQDIREHSDLRKGRLFVRPFGSENWVTAQNAT
jgi:copper chaperone NosL